MRAEYRVAVIGHTGRGNYGHGLDRVWQELPECELVAVADADPAGLAAAADRLDVQRGYADYRRMLEVEKPDIVAVAPRWVDQHRDMVVAAADCGAHIYLEKPMCRSPQEADDMVAACERNGVKLAIAFQTRYSPRLAAVRRLVDEGRLGRILELRGRGKEDRRGGGEDLWVLGSHIMNLIHQFGGEPNWCFATVLQGNVPIGRDDVLQGNEGLGPLAGDNLHAMYGLDEGMVAYFDSRKDAAGGRFGLKLFGEQGVVEILTGHLPDVWFLDDPAWSPGRSGRDWQPVSSDGIGRPEPHTDGGLHAGNVLAVRDLLLAIEEDRQPEASVYEGRVTVEMICGVFASHLAGRPVDFPLASRLHSLAAP